MLARYKPYRSGERTRQAIALALRENISFAEAARRSGVTSVAVYSALATAKRRGEDVGGARKNPRAFWTADRIAELNRHHADNAVTYAEIARRMGISESAVYVMARKLNLPSRRKRRQAR